MKRSLSEEDERRKVPEGKESLWLETYEGATYRALFTQTDVGNTVTIEKVNDISAAKDSRFIAGDKAEKSFHWFRLFLPKCHTWAKTGTKKQTSRVEIMAEIFPV